MAGTSLPPRSAPPFSDDVAGDADGFAEEPGFSISLPFTLRLPADLDVWLGGMAGALIVIAALLAGFADVAGVLQGRGVPATGAAFPAPTGSISVLLLGGVLLLLVRGRSRSARSSRGRVRALACVAAAGATALAVAQVAAAIEAMGAVQGLAELGPSQLPAWRVFTALGTLGEGAVSLLALLAAVLLYHWTHLEEARAASGATETATQAVRGAEIGGVVAAALFGAAVSAGCLIAFQQGLTQPAIFGSSPPRGVTPLVLPTGCSVAPGSSTVCSSYYTVPAP